VGDDTQIIQLDSANVMSCPRCNYLWLTRSLVKSCQVLRHESCQSRIPAMAFMLGHASELIAKLILMDAGKSVSELRGKKYGHKIQSMWAIDTDLLDRGVMICHNLREEGVVPKEFDFEKHFRIIAHSHSSDSGYALRYGGKNLFPDTDSMTIVIAHLLEAIPDKH